MKLKVYKFHFSYTTESNAYVLIKAKDEETARKKAEELSNDRQIEFGDTCDDVSGINIELDNEIDNSVCQKF